MKRYASLCVLVFGASPAVAGTCEPEWTAYPEGPNEVVLSAESAVIGGIPALYFGGAFNSVNGVTIRGIVRWDGSAWSQLGNGIGTTYADVRSIEVVEEPGGTVLYAGGSFASAGGQPANGVAKWDGTTWTPLGTGTTNNALECIQYFDLGDGPKLYAGGNFTTFMGSPIKRVAAWNGTGWNEVGTGLDSTVRDFTTFDFGGGSRLVATGDFQNVAGTLSTNAGVFDGAGWSAMGVGVNDGSVFGVTSYRPNSTDMVVYYGVILQAGGVPVSGLAGWDGASWSKVGTGTNTDVVSAVGNETDLYVTRFQSGPRYEIDRWNGTSFERLGTGFDEQVRCMAVHDDGNGPKLYVGGRFTSTRGEASTGISVWNGNRWSNVGGAPNVQAIAATTFDFGSGPRLVVGGQFTSIDGVAVNRVAVWTGSVWSPLSTGMNGPVLDLEVVDLGAGPRLFALGTFSTAGGSPASRVAMWNGTNWQGLGFGLSADPLVMAGFDDGTGMALYVGGTFNNAGGVAVQNLAKWNGTAWSAVGGGTNGSVTSMKAISDVQGPGLCISGTFSTVGGSTAAQRVARWNGTAWQGLNGLAGNSVNAIEVFDDGSGNSLYAGGNFFFNSPNGRIEAVARWTGSDWVPVEMGLMVPVFSLATHDFDGPGGQPARLYAGTGVATSLEALPSGAGGVVTSTDGATWTALPLQLDTPPKLFSVNLGTGPRLIGVGTFTRLNRVSTNGLARWNGSEWERAGKGMCVDVRSLDTVNEPGGQGLFVGGSFTSDGPRFLARWDGSDWTLYRGQMDEAANSPVYVERFDPDGPGAEQESIYIASQFDIPGSPLPLRGVARWNGAAWERVGNVSMTGAASGMGVQDPDGNGPLLPRLYVVGVGMPFSSSFNAWDGAQWHPQPNVNSGGFSMTIADTGVGPRIFAGGTFTTIGTRYVGTVAQWNGAEWLRIPATSTIGVNARALASFDTDGSGPLPASLFVGGSFTSGSGGIMANRVAQWNGIEWINAGAGLTGTVEDLRVIDDGTGPALYAAGFDLIGTNRIVRWDGSAWSPVVAVNGAITTNTVNCVVEHDDDGPGPFGPALYAGGTFNAVGPFPTNRVARYGCTTPAPSCGGDANDDSFVDSADLSVLLFQFTTSVTPGSGADFNGDGVVNSADLSVLLANFGKACS